MKKVFLVMAFLGVSSLAWGQASSGTITGNVLDPTGAAVPEVEITVTHLATNVSTTVPSTAAGVYRILGLNPGEYRVEATVSGFKTFRQEPVIVFTGTTTTVDIPLEVGAVTETVEVLAQATPLNLVSSEMSGEIEERSLFDLPLKVNNNRRDLDSFIVLTPGVTGTAFAKNINGSQNMTTETIIDGISWQIARIPGIVGGYGPPYEAVSEFKIQTSNFPAEFSRGYGVTNFTLKSGTNQFHGNVFDFLRNDKLEANDFFRNARGQNRAITRQNEYGATVGGPIIKDKTFFFFAFTGFRLRGGARERNLLTLPTALMRQGNFSELLDTSKTGAAFPIQIYDPATTRPDGAGGFVRDAFPGNIIPSDRISNVANLVTQNIPNPETGALTSNFISQAEDPSGESVWSLKFDHNISSRQKLSGSGWVREFNVDITLDFKGPLDNGLQRSQPGRGLRLSHDFFIRPNLINHVGIGYGSRITIGSAAEGAYTLNNANHYNIPNLPTAPRGVSPSWIIAGMPALGGIFDSSSEIGHSYNFVDTITWIKGRHTFKGGVDIRAYQQNMDQCRACSGTFQFDNRTTSQPNSPNFGTLGHPYASFLLGQSHTFTQERGIGSARGYRVGYYAGFFQDEVKLTPKLTMNIGLRIEVPTPASEQYDRLSSLILDRPNPGAGGLPGALGFLGSGPGGIGSRRFVPIPTDLSPRLGFAYRFNDKTVVRWGYGILRSQSNGVTLGPIVNSLRAGFTFDHFLTTLDNGVTPAVDMDTGPPAIVIDLPNTDPSLQNGGRIDYFNNNGHKAGYVNAWNLSVQRELPSRILVDLAYVGQKGVNLAAGMENLGQVPYERLSLGPLLTKDINHPDVVAAGFGLPYEGFKGSLAQALRPYPQYTAITSWVEPTGSSSYHSFQMKIQKQFSRGLSFLVSYTASKSLTNQFRNAFAVNGPDPIFTEDRRLYWAPAQLDSPHNLAMSGVYELPFGPGKRFANTGGAIGKIIGGWQVAAIARYLSGNPIEVLGGPSLPIFGGRNRPNRVAGVPVRTSVGPGNFDPATDKWFNINAFSAPPPLAVCAANPRSCRGNLAPRLSDGRNFAFLSEDISFFKFIPFTEHIRLEFRAEFYNAFNRAVFRARGTENFDSPAGFGDVTGTQLPPRQIQMGLKLHF